MVHDPAVPGAFELRYWGVTGRDYYLARSWDLLSWQYFPVIEPGQDAVVSYSFIDPAPQVFVRLVHEPASGPNPYAADSDGDGLTNQQEIDLRTDLFSTDTDRDKLPDAWEVSHGLDPRNPADALADPDSDDRSTAQEFLENTDPKVADVSRPSSGPTPAAPGQPTVEELSPTSFRLTWSPGDSTPLLGYLIERSTDNVTWALIGFTAGNTTSYDDTQALSGTAYSYRVKGVY